MSNNIKLWLIGSGVIAIEYSKVLQKLNIPFEVIGRGEKSAANFNKSINIPVNTGGLDKWLEKPDRSATAAIVAVSADQLSDAALKLIRCGVKKILVEKPVGLNKKQIDNVNEQAEKYGAEVFVAYNRRFYASVLKSQEIIKEDGGVSSFHFEFTEWSHVIETLEHHNGALENWFLLNSTHVVDTAFFLAGKPVKISCYTAGELKWHHIAIYSGAGKTETGALFSYHANWQAPGRWGIEIMTKKHRLILKPMEKLQIMNIESVESEFVPLMDKYDLEYKPGFYKQVEAFLGSNSQNLIPIKKHIDNMKYYQIMNNENNKY